MEVLQYYPWLFVVFASIFGLIVGSFLNVVIYRLPKIMELEWRRECAESFPEYKIKPPQEVLTLSVPRSSCQKLRDANSYSRQYSCNQLAIVKRKMPSLSYRN